MPDRVTYRCIPISPFSGTHRRQVPPRDTWLGVASPDGEQLSLLVLERAGDGWVEWIFHVLRGHYTPGLPGYLADLPVLAVTVCGGEPVVVLDGGPAPSKPVGPVVGKA